MKKIAILLFLSIYSHTYPMLSTAELNSDLANLGAILKQEIFTVPCFCRGYSCLQDAAVSINALAKTNTFLNKSINEEDRTLALIKQLSRQFDCPNIDVACVLCTKAANNRYILQTAFLVRWNSVLWDPVKKNVNKLHSMGLDLNFSYNKQLPTPLLQTVAWQETGYSRVANWLIEKGADITCCTPDGRNASMIALAGYNDTLIDALIDHQAFNVNHQDNNKYTPLLCCYKGLFAYDLERRQTDRRLPFVYKTIEKLLQKGANPTVIDEHGWTLLDLVRELGYQPLVELLEKAIADFNFKISVNRVL